MNSHNQNSPENGDGIDGEGLSVRAAESTDIDAVIRLDEKNTGLAKAEYWRDVYDRYTGRKERYFLVAEQGGTVLGFILGEIRAWEFGSPPCGWVFAVGVEPDTRLKGTGTRLLDAICRRFGDAGMEKVRTMLAVDDNLNMSFFRSQGMRGGPFLQLERDLAPPKTTSGQGGDT